MSRNYTQTISRCQPRARCRRWRVCPTCAAIRQAKIADATERLYRLGNAATWTTLQPDHAGASALIAARDQFLKQNKPAGAVWTVEQSPSSGRLHCNIITIEPPSQTHQAASLFIAQVTHDPRQVGAYISKQSQMPDQTIFPGRIYGTAGPLWQYITSGEAPVPIQAAARQYEIDPSPEITRPAQNKPMEKETAREIAARHLPDILPYMRPRRPN